MANTSGDETWATLRRCWIERTAARTGFAPSRKEICAALGLSMAQASADLQQLQIEHPRCFKYNLNLKRYEWTGKKIVTQIPAFVADLRD